MTIVSLQPPYRAEQVGSFLRPKYLLDARARFKDGLIDAAGLRAVEDTAISEVVNFQEALGLRVVGDGEFRRTFFHVDFLVQLDGVTEKGGMSIKFHRAEGDIDYAPPVLEISGPVRHSKPIQRADFEYLKSVTSTARALPKVTIPSPTMLHFRAGRQGISKEAYPDIAEFYADVAKAFQQEIADLAGAGLRYLQLDDTNLAYLCDPEQRARAKARGHDPDDLPREYAKLINAALAGRPRDMLTGIHLCRGNFRSSWAAEGGYEPVSEVLFNSLDVDTYFLEYDDARSGDFRPLRHVPKGKIIVLGLVTTKLGELESKDSIKRRIDEAAKYCPLEQLALSPQCGFSSTVHGNDVSFAQQAAKMQLVMDVAREVWGGS
jgi:5-methyltetrahydropteroyltriglutamate--homocysteine methyltransferase